MVHRIRFQVKFIFGFLNIFSGFWALVQLLGVFGFSNTSGFCVLNTETNQDPIYILKLQVFNIYLNYEPESTWARKKPTRIETKKIIFSWVHLGPKGSITEMNRRVIKLKTPMLKSTLSRYILCAFY